ncbi:MAG: hypothetical protein ACK5K7_07380 [Bacilli bacterium]
MDNDVVVGENTNFNRLISENKNSDFMFKGKEVSMNTIPRLRNIINEYADVLGLDLKKKNYINTGITLINMSHMKKVPEYESIDSIVSYIKKYIKFCVDNLYPVTDQEFLYCHFSEQIGFIEPKWNIRFFDKDSMINNSENDFVLHFCIKYLSFPYFNMEKIKYEKYFAKAIEKSDADIFFKGIRRYMNICMPSF